jgi:hypothetical protein
VSRDQWSVDDDLSRLKDEIKGSMSQHRNSDDDEPVHHGHHQQIKGNSNVQVAGNLTLNEHKTIDPNHPDAIECPQCRKLTYRLSHWCTESEVSPHFTLLLHKRRQLVLLVAESPSKAEVVANNVAQN